VFFYNHVTNWKKKS